MENNHLDALAEMYKGLANSKRLELIGLLHDRVSLNGISKTLAIKRSSMQLHLDSLRAGGLIEKDKSENITKYALTPLGNIFYEHIKRVGEGDWMEEQSKLNTLNSTVELLESEPDAADHLGKILGAKIRPLEDIKNERDEVSDIVLQPFKAMYAK